MTDTRTTASVMAHVQAERAMQLERWGWRHDALHGDEEWNALIAGRLSMPGASRYIRLVQAAALAIAAAERQPILGADLPLSDPRP